MNPSDAQLARALDATALERLREAETTGEFKSPTSRSDQFFGGGTDLPYQEKIGAAEARRLILAHAPLMRRFGYLDEAAVRFSGLSSEEVETVQPAA